MNPRRLSLAVDGSTCVLCGHGAPYTLSLALDGGTLERIALCKAHAAAVQLGDWRLTVYREHAAAATLTAWSLRPR